MKKQPLNIFFTVVFVVFLFTACKKENDFPVWDTDILSPLIKSTLTLKNLLNDTLLIENPDSSLKLVYHDKFYDFSIDSLFTVPDTTFSYAYPPFAFPYYHIDSNEVLMNNAGQSYFNMGNVYLTYARIKSGYIRVETYNEFKQKINVEYTIPSATLFSVPFHAIEQVPAATAAGPAIFTKTYSLAGYDVDFRGAYGDKFNTIALSVIAKAADSVSIYLGDSAVFRNTYFDIVPEYARGYFGKDTATIGPEETPLTLFDNVEAGSLLLEDAIVKINIDNYAGVDARVELNTWYSTNTFYASSVNLSSGILGSPVNINRATESAGAFSSLSPSSWNVVLNNTNSNMKALMENLPDVLGYGLKIQTNPLGNISGYNDFIYTDRTIEASVDIEVPLNLSANGLTLVDTVDFSLQMNAQSENVNHGVFTLYANNGFPFDATIQLYILNQNNVIIDSLLTGNKTIASGLVDGNFKVTGKKLSNIPIPLSSMKLQLLEDTRKMIVKVKYDTNSNPQLVKLYSHYGIDIRLVGDFNFTVNFNE